MQAGGAIGRGTRWVVALIFLGLGCGGSAGGPAAGGSGGGAGLSPDGAAVSADAGGSSGMTDEQLCQHACRVLIDCGVLYDATCAAGCLASPVFRLCVRTAPDDCNSLAMCAFHQAAATACGGAGVPAGTGTCAQAAACEAACGASNAPASCSCACWKALSPTKAINLLINNQCAAARCPGTCGPAGSNACNACFSSGVCAAQNAQCTSN